MEGTIYISGPGIDKLIGDTYIVLVQYQDQIVILSFHWTNMDGIEWEKSRFKKAFKKVRFGDKWVYFKTLLNLG